MNKYFLIFCLIIFALKSHALVVNEKIYTKYDLIFEKNILSKSDTANYQKIFEFQVECNWKKANRHILLLNDRILMGHVLSQRYLHPKCYRSQFIELTNWLKKYNDHPQARKIYILAIKRMPKGYRSPTKPIKPKGIVVENLKTSNQSELYKSKKKLSKNQRIEKQKLINSIKSRVNSGWPTGAVKLLNHRDLSKLLDQTEIDQQKELIAKGYFLANKNKLSIKYSLEALENSALHVPYAGWTGGLAAWRLEKYTLAAELFSNFSISLKHDVWHQSSGSFWAARAHAKLNEYENINFWLNRAAKNPNSFYGILASEILGIDSSINWQLSESTATERNKYFALPSGKRIQSLIQIGLADQLEDEIIYLNTVLNKDVAMWSLDIAQHFNLAYTQLKIAHKLQKYDVKLPSQYFYPTPIWQPQKGFTLHPELLYAFMHQESMFNEKAKSHKGAMGLMQILPSTAKFISSNKRVKQNNENILKIPEINIEVGQEYIEYLLQLKSVENNLIYLTAAYNGGPGNLKKWQENTNYLDDPLLFMESIPSRETRWFIEKVLTKYWIYLDKNGLESKSLHLLANGKNPIY